MKTTSMPHCASDAAVVSPPSPPPTTSVGRGRTPVQVSCRRRAPNAAILQSHLSQLDGPSSNLYDGMSIIHASCSDLVMLDRLRQYLKELADAECEGSRLVREHGSKASQVIAADIEVARKQGDATTVRRLKRVASAIAAIEESPAALLHR